MPRQRIRWLTEPPITTVLAAAVQRGATVRYRGRVDGVIRRVWQSNRWWCEATFGASSGRYTDPEDCLRYVWDHYNPTEYTIEEPDDNHDQSEDY